MSFLLLSSLAIVVFAQVCADNDAALADDASLKQCNARIAVLSRERDQLASQVELLARKLAASNAVRADAAPPSAPSPRRYSRADLACAGLSLSLSLCSGVDFVIV